MTVKITIPRKVAIVLCYEVFLCSYLKNENQLNNYKRYLNSIVKGIIAELYSKFKVNRYNKNFLDHT